MAIAARQFGIDLPDRGLACAAIGSDVEKKYFGAMRTAINCALTNQQFLTRLVRDVLADVLPRARLPLPYDMSHNTCKVEQHRIDGATRKLCLHRKGATRAFGPGHPHIPEPLVCIKG